MPQRKMIEPEDMLDLATELDRFLTRFDMTLVDAAKVLPTSDGTLGHILRYTRDDDQPTMSETLAVRVSEGMLEHIQSRKSATKNFETVLDHVAYVEDQLDDLIAELAEIADECMPIVRPGFELVAMKLNEIRSEYLKPLTR